MKHKRNVKGIKAFGKNLKRIRKLKGITQEDLSFSTGIELRQIGRIERGEINTGISSVFEIAKILGVEAKDLFDF
jgi:transcriptional regulator with XRE-family HTH domain